MEDVVRRSKRQRISFVSWVASSDEDERPGIPSTSTSIAGPSTQGTLFSSQGSNLPSSPPGYVSSPSLANPSPSPAARHRQQVLVLGKLAIALIFDCCVYLDLIFNESDSTGSCKIQLAATLDLYTCRGWRNANNVAAGSERATEAEGINMIISGGTCPSLPRSSNIPES